jgi:hypothetical protein
MTRISPPEFTCAYLLLPPPVPEPLVLAMAVAGMASTTNASVTIAAMRFILDPSAIGALTRSKVFSGPSGTTCAVCEFSVNIPERAAIRAVYMLLQRNRMHS